MRPFVVILVLFLGGCYTYVPAIGPGLHQGTPVRARLSAPRSFNVGEFTLNSVTSVRGEVVQWNPDELVLSAFWLVSDSGREHAGNGRTITISEARLETLERKEFSILKTGAIAGVALVAALLGDLAFNGGGGDGAPAPGGTSPVTK